MEFSILDHCDPWQNFTIMHIAQIQALKSSIDKSNTRHA